MQLKPATGPYLLMAGGGAVLILALISFQLPMFAAAAALAWASGVCASSTPAS
jgi:hypothetical protein